MLERRKSIRGKTLLGASVATRERSSTLDCVVRNLSPEGAKLSFGDLPAIPAEFDLTISKRDKTFRARRVWQRADEAGVAFVTPSEQPAAAALDIVLRLRKSEAERAKLKQRVAQLTNEF